MASEKKSAQKKSRGSKGDTPASRKIEGKIAPDPNECPAGTDTCCFPFRGSGRMLLLLLINYSCSTVYYYQLYLSALGVSCILRNTTFKQSGWKDSDFYEQAWRGHPSDLLQTPSCGATKLQS